MQIPRHEYVAHHSVAVQCNTYQPHFPGSENSTVNYNLGIHVSSARIRRSPAQRNTCPIQLYFLISGTSSTFAYFRVGYFSIQKHVRVAGFRSKSSNILANFSKDSDIAVHGNIMFEIRTTNFEFFKCAVSALPRLIMVTTESTYGFNGNHLVRFACTHEWQARRSSGGGASVHS